MATALMPARFEIVIPDWRPPTLNQVMRGKLRDRMRLGRSCRDMVAIYFAMAGAARAAGPRRVSLRVALSGRQRPFDRDAPWKTMLDSLKACGAILDDSVRWCAIGDLEFSRADRTSTTIILEDFLPRSEVPCA